MHPNIVKVRDAETGQVITLDLYKNTRTMTDASGRLVTMDLGQQDVHIDRALANYAAGYTQWEGLADQVSPIIPTPNASDKFYTWDKDDVFQSVEDLIVGPNAAVKEISPRLSSATFTTVAYGVGASVPLEVSANADSPLKIEMAAVRRCKEAIFLGREARVATSIMTAANWTGGYTNTIAAGAKWNGGASSDPIRDIMTAQEASLTPVRAIAMSERTWHDFFQNAAVQKYVASKIDAPPLGKMDMNSQANIVNDKMNALLGLPPILIGRMRKKTSLTTYGMVWGDNVALINNDPAVPSDGQRISTHRTFRWTGSGASPDGTMQGGFLVRSYFDPKRGAHGARVIVVTHNDAEVMTSVYAGGLLVGAHQ